jgi:hypothetical protein
MLKLNCQRALIEAWLLPRLPRQVPPVSMYKFSDEAGDSFVMTLVVSPL